MDAVLPLLRFRAPPEPSSPPSSGEVLVASSNPSLFSPSPFPSSVAADSAVMATPPNGSAASVFVHGGAKGLVASEAAAGGPNGSSYPQKCLFVKRKRDSRREERGR